MPGKPKLHNAIKRLSRAMRPKALKLAAEGRLLATVFAEFADTVYPDAPPDQLRELRVAFFAGAAELHALQTYIFDVDTPEPTDSDMRFLSNLLNEIEFAHERTLADTMKTTGSA